MTYPDDLLKAEAEWHGMTDEERHRGTLLLYHTRRLVDVEHAEIERLHDELSTFRQGKHHTENAELKAEIERLRGLLRDVVWSYWPPPPSWYAEAKEAAGEALGD